MLVAYGAEFGDDSKVAPLPEVVGHIQTAIGCGILTHADDTAAQVVPGAPVCRGDAIETGPDGRIEIRFIDGTVFNLSGDSRVVLREFVCDSDRADSALFAVTKGTFAFVAGRVASTGSFWIDTPVGNIRGWTHAGGFGMLSLAALVFSFVKEAQAADPDVTFLDEDHITYKDFEHGVFELVTKEPIPRHIIVEDPGQTIVLSKKGSSVNVNQVANSLGRMEELQTAQQDVLANLTKGIGPAGSSAAPFSDPQLAIEPINFIENDTIQPQNSLVPLETAVFTFPDFPIIPSPPTLQITDVGGQIGVAASNIINAAEANAGIQITGITSGVEDGQIVTVTIVDSSDRVVYSGTATVANNTWSINVSPAEAKTLADGIDTLTADVMNSAGNLARATHAIRVDETPPTIAINAFVSNNVVNVKAASAGFSIAGTATDAENGQSVTVNIVDSSGQVVDTFTTTLTNNTWSVNVTSTEAKLLHDGSYTVTADVSDTAGNPAQEARQAITVDETPPTVTWLPPAESGIEGMAITLGAITATANSLPGHSNSVQSLVVSGIPVGAVLTDGTNSFVATSDDTAIDVKSWNLSNLKITPPNDTNFTLTVTATDQDANTASTGELVTVTPLAPVLNPVAAQGNEGTAIALDLGAMAKSLLGANGDASPNSLATLVVSEIPVGATLSDGTGLPGHHFTAVAGDTSFDLAGWNLSSLKITPPTEFEGSFTLKIAATERDSEGDISATVTATEVVTVAPVAEPPTASAPATLVLNENATCVAIAGVSVGPLAEDADDTVSATLTVSHGTLHVADLSGVTVTGDDCATLTLSGSAAEVNTLLAGLNYTPTTEYEGADTLHLSVTSSDGSDTYPTAATTLTAITVNPVARPPTASAPPTLTLNENVADVAIAGLRVGPLAEDNDDTVSATLTVSQGTLHVAGLGGVTVLGDDCATLTLSGSAAEVNTLLAGLTYTPTAEYEGADTLHLSVTSSDGSNTYPTAAIASTSITVKPVAEAPTATAPATITFEEDADTVAIAGVSVGPLAEDSDDTVTATLTVSHGTLRVGSLSGVTVTGDDCATLTLSGSAAAVNKLLAGLTYMPFEEEGPDTLHLSVTSSDGSNTYPTPATATTAIRLEVDSESLIVGGPGPTLDWNDAANWSAGIVPTLGIDVTINAPSNYTAIITGAPVAQAESLTIPHGAASTEIAVGGALQLAGDLNISFSGKLENDGTLEETANASFVGPIINDGAIIVDPNVRLDVTGTITGNGKFWIDSGTTLEFAPGTKVAPGTTDSQTIYFEQDGGKLIIDDWGKFAGVITGTAIGAQLTSTDLIDLTQLPFVGGSMSASVSYNSGTNISTVTFSDGISSNNVMLHLSGNYTGATWTFKSIDGRSGTEITDPPAASGTVTSSATGETAAASAMASDLASASGTNASLEPSNSQNFTRQVAGFTGASTTGTLSATAALANSLTKGGGGYGALPMMAAGASVYAPDNSGAAAALNIGDALTDFIMGGFGAVLLTGGNGNDTSGSSSAAESPAARFDTIADFSSGSDKIDLTAFGSLAFVKLTSAPTSTSVPAHTMAWLFHSATNETIVYVNPTDQPLSISGSGLVEIHLQGVSSVHSSDFVLAPAASHVVADSASFDPAATTADDASVATTTTADVLSAAIAGDGALPAEAGSTQQTTTASPAPDKIAWIEVQTGSVEKTADETVTIAPGGQPADLPHIALTALTETSFTFDHVPTSDHTDATGGQTSILTPDHSSKIDSGTGVIGNEDNGASSQKNLSSVDTAAAHVRTADVDSNPGDINAPENGDGDHSDSSEAGEHGPLPGHGVAAHDVERSSIDVDANTALHPGGPKASENGAGSHSISSDAGESGPWSAPGADVHDTERSSIAHAVLGSGAVDALGLGDSFHFKDETSASGVAGVAAPDHVPAWVTHHDDEAGTHGTLAVWSQALDPPLPAPGDDLGVVPDHEKGHVVTHVQHDLIV